MKKIQDPFFNLNILALKLKLINIFNMLYHSKTASDQKIDILRQIWNWQRSRCKRYSNTIKTWRSKNS